MYHPDKNPGRAHEVLPIFRWVQTRWDEEFRSSENGIHIANNGAAGSTGQAHTSGAGAQRGRTTPTRSAHAEATCASTERNKALPSTSTALEAKPRKRLLRKTKVVIPAST